MTFKATAQALDTTGAVIHSAEATSDQDSDAARRAVDLVQEHPDGAYWWRIAVVIDQID